MIKKAIVFLLITGSAVFAVLILTSSNPKVAPPIVKSVLKNETVPLESPQSSNPNLTQQNTTEEIAKDVAQELAKRNSGNSSFADGKRGISVAQPEELVNKIFPNQLKNLDFPNLRPEVKLSDLKIIKSNDKKLAENYFQNLQVILKNNLATIFEHFSEPSAENFKAISLAHQKAVAQLYNLVVPESLANTHREEIRLLITQKNIFENLANYQKDPVKALVSARLLPEIDKQLDKLASQN